MRATLFTFNITHTIRTSLFALLTIVFLLGCNDEKPQTKDTDNGSVFKSNGQLFYFPNANAGSNQQLKQGKALFLDANKSSDSDGSIVSYEWKEGNTVLSNAVSFSKSDFSLGTHAVTLTVTDDDGLTDSDTIDIVVIEDMFPIAVAENNETIKLGSTIILDANKSSDSDGSIVSYEWKEGNAVLSNAVSFSKSDFSLGTHTVTLTVTDDYGNISTDIVVIQVFKGEFPIADAGDNISSRIGDNVFLNASKSSDSDGTIVGYEWKEDNVTLSNSSSFSKSDFSLGTHTIVLTVTDDDNNSNSDDINIIIYDNEPPIANAGINQSVRIGKSVTLNAGGSSDNDGFIVSYEWKEGETVLSNLSSFSKSDFSLGAHIIVLTVTDNDGVAKQDTININIIENIIENIAPVADAGEDIKVIEGDTVSLDASNSTDSDGSIVSYAWKEGCDILSTEATFSYLFSTSTTIDSCTDTTNGVQGGVHTITLTVTDNDGATASDTVVVTVNTQVVNYIIKKTGQTISYDENGTEVTDNSLKDDGYYQTGLTPDYTRASDIVKDEITGLMWQDDEAAKTITKQWLTDTNYETCYQDNSSPTCNDTNGDTATTYCLALSLGGYTDWRLPTSSELDGIIDYNKDSPSIDTAYFNNFYSGSYWTDTTYCIYKS